MKIGKNEKLSKQDATLIQGSETVNFYLSNFYSLHALRLVLFNSILSNSVMHVHIVNIFI